MLHRHEYLHVGEGQANGISDWVRSPLLCRCSQHSKCTVPANPLCLLCRAWAAASYKRSIADVKEAREDLKHMMAAAPRGATRLKADWGGGWGGAAVKSSGSECAWCHENVIEVKKCSVCKVGGCAEGCAMWAVGGLPVFGWGEGQLLPVSSAKRVSNLNASPAACCQCSSQSATRVHLPCLAVQAVAYCSRECQVAPAAPAPVHA